MTKTLIQKADGTVPGNVWQVNAQAIADEVAPLLPSGGGGSVTSVNTQTGDVVLTAPDVGAPTLAAHQQLANDLAAKVPALRQVQTAGSLSGGGDLSGNRLLELLGDVGSPGASQYYGTNGAALRGWYDLPAGGSGGGVVHPAVAFVELTGNDGTAVPGDPSAPFATVAAAWSALAGLPVAERVLALGVGIHTLSIDEVVDMDLRVTGRGASVTQLHIAGEMARVTPEPARLTIHGDHSVAAQVSASVATAQDGTPGSHGTNGGNGADGSSVTVVLRSCAVVSVSLYGGNGGNGGNGWEDTEAGVNHTNGGHGGNGGGALLELNDCHVQGACAVNYGEGGSGGGSLATPGNVGYPGGASLIAKRSALGDITSNEIKLHTCSAGVLSANLSELGATSYHNSSNLGTQNDLGGNSAVSPPTW